MNEPLGQIVGRNVAALRIKQGYNKTDFCLMVGISRPYLNYVESGESNITLNELQRLADGLAVQPTRLLEPLD